MDIYIHRVREVEYPNTVRDFNNGRKRKVKIVFSVYREGKRFPTFLGSRATIGEAKALARSKDKNAKIKVV